METAIVAANYVQGASRASADANIKRLLVHKTDIQLMDIIGEGIPVLVNYQSVTVIDPSICSYIRRRIQSSLSGQIAKGSGKDTLYSTNYDGCRQDTKKK